MKATRRGGKIRVLIVDDHLLFAEGMQAILREHGFDVVGIASTGREAVAMARATRPDSIVMDIALPDIDGLTAGGIILEELPDTRIVAVTAIDHPDVVRDALRSGFNGCLLKHASMPDVVGALIASTHSQAVIPMQAVSTIMAASTPRPEDQEWPSMLKQLTRREREVLGLLAEGMSGRDIAERLFLSRNTVRTHIQNILTKLQVHSRLQAAALATRHGIVGGSAGPFAEPRVSPRPGRWLSSEDGRQQEKPDRVAEQERRSGDGRVRVERREPGGPHDDSQEIR
jgi:DNA-binding NarL/FixJ family response regulator